VAQWRFINTHTGAVLMPEASSRLHQRFLQQAGWTKAVRQRAFLQFGLGGLARILEVGSGTGAITDELRRASSGIVIGLDRDPNANAFAHASDRQTVCVTGLGERLPFPPNCYDLTCCHFLLLWVADPLAVLLEMNRVTRPGGGVLCLAEPDYGGRIDYPDSLSELGVLQEGALQAQGADTRLGRRLRILLHQAGLTDVEAGVLGGEWADSEAEARGERDLEWQTLADDLTDRISTAELRRMQSEFARAHNEGSRILFVPTFYGWGRRPPSIPHQPSLQPRQTG
jgi:SAM-dependent methyltransferase